MKMPRIILPKKKLRATTARRGSLGLPDAMDYEEMSEPNMKLSRALLIVLVLHVVAVAGIVAFNTIKTRQVLSSPPVANAKIEPSATPTTSANPAAIREEEKPTHLATKILAKEERRTEEITKPSAKITSGVSSTAKTYVVEKGDNPLKIAKKFHVPYDDLIAANHISDPHKLKIGQKLLVPVKVVKAKKAGE